MRQPWLWLGGIMFGPVKIEFAAEFPAKLIYSSRSGLRAPRRFRRWIW